MRVADSFYLEPNEPPRYRYYEPEFYPSTCGRNYDVDYRTQSDYFATPFGLFKNYTLKKNMFSNSNKFGKFSENNSGYYKKKYNENEPLGEAHNYPSRKSDFEEMLDIFKEQLKMEINLDNLKQDLLRQPDFRVIDLFLLFDDNQTYQITLQELQQGLATFGIKADFADLRLLVKRYSRDGNEKLG